MFLRSLTFPGFLAASLLALIACRNSAETDRLNEPFLQITNGRFEVQPVVLYNDTTYAGMPMGSGSLEFDYDGDLKGRFTANGALFVAQKDSQGVAAIIAKLFSIDFQEYREGLSLVGFRPRGDGAADIFVLGTKVGVALDSIQTGFSYGIGPLQPFNGLFLVGLDINEFWAGEKNFIEIAENAFVLSAGIITIDSRDSLRVSGQFAGTTDINRTPKVSLRE